MSIHRILWLRTLSVSLAVCSFSLCCVQTTQAQSCRSTTRLKGATQTCVTAEQQSTILAPQAAERLQRLVPRMDCYVRHCQKVADQAGAEQRFADQHLVDHERKLQESLKILGLLRDLLENQLNGQIQLGEQAFSVEQVGSFLATKLDEHQKLEQQTRQLRLEAIEKAAQRRGADQQLARWQQQQRDLIAQVSALQLSSQSASLIPQHRRYALAQQLANELEATLPPSGDLQQ